MEQKFGEKGQSFSVLLREIIGEFNTVELWGPQALKVLRKVLKNGESKRCLSDTSISHPPFNFILFFHFLFFIPFFYPTYPKLLFFLFPLL